MANTILGWKNNVSAATLSAGSAALPIANLQLDQGSAESGWQTAAGVVTSAGGAWFLIDSGSTASVWRAFGLFRTNLTSAATWRVRVGDVLSGSQITTPYAYDSGTVSGGVQPGYLQAVLVADADRTRRYCQIDINDAANTDGFINVPLCYAGPLWFPLSAAAWDSTVGRDDQTDEVVSRGGQEYPVNRYVKRRWEISLPGVRATEVWAQAGELDRTARLGGNVLFAPDTTSATLQNEAIFGRLKAKADISYPYQAADRRAWSATLTERI